MKLHSYLGDFTVKISLEFRAYVQQSAVRKSEHDGWRKVQFAAGQVLEAIHRGGVVGPDFDAAIEVRISSAEEISASHGPQQMRRFFQHKSDTPYSSPAQT